MENSNKQIADQVFQTMSHVNQMYYIAMSLQSKKLKKLLNNFDNFEETFPKISREEWGVYSDLKELPTLLDLHKYNGWLVEVIVPRRKHLKPSNPFNKVKRRKFIYCDHLKDVIPTMLEFSKDVLEEDIIEFNRGSKDGK
ncbi:hypothetical protein [Flavobacterium panacagri]|uniref:hypothetical protein n=1 Tax=Flavobacterium panacagri TaxID=3034146 RepID=UPI0025A68A4D|nr:hypothetical protein [Flavobacterium panacagri]